MALKQGICKGCGELKTLIRAHIIPESFCKLFNGKSKPARIVASQKYVKNSHTGPYDPEILCESCEEKFSLPDGYAQKLLIHSEDQFKWIGASNNPDACIIENYDYELLQRFLISVLWRASVSELSHFKNVQLGAHAQNIKNIALSKNVEKNTIYKFAAGRLLDKNKHSMMLFPFRERINGVNAWRIYAGTWHFWLKVDSGREFPYPLNLIEAKPNQPLISICRTLADSPEYAAALNAVINRKIGKTS